MRRYKDAFAPVPDQTVTRVEDTLRHLPRHEGKTAPTRRPRLALVLAMALVLTLCGGAVAAERLGVLDFLFGMSGSTEEQQQMVQEVNLTQKAGMATITVTNAIFDGRQLSMALIFDADQPTYAMAEGLWLNGALVSENDFTAFLGWFGWDLAQRGKSGLTAITDETLTGPVEARLRLMLLQPKKAIEIIDDSGENPIGAAREAIRDGLTPVDLASAGGFANLDEPKVLFPDNDTDYSLNRDSLSYAAMYNMNVEEVWLTFSIETGDAYTGETICVDVVNSDDLPFTVVVRRAELTLVGSHFVLDFYPKEGGLERPQDLDGILTTVFSFWEDKARMLEFQSSSTNYGHSSWYVDEQGQPFYRLIHETGPIPELPESLWLVFESVPSFHALWQWGIELRPTDVPVSQEIPAAEPADFFRDLPYYLMNGDAVAEGNKLVCRATMSTWLGNATVEDLMALWSVREVYDLNGRKLPLSTGGAGLTEADAGDNVFTITQAVALPDELPDAVYLVPVDGDTGECNWDYAILLPVGKD